MSDVTRNVANNRLKIEHKGVPLVPKLIREVDLIISGITVPIGYYLYMDNVDPQAIVTISDQTIGQTVGDGYINIEVAASSTAGVTTFIDGIQKFVIPALEYVTPEPKLPRSPPYHTFETGAIGYWTYQI